MRTGDRVKGWLFVLLLGMPAIAALAETEPNHSLENANPLELNGEDQGQLTLDDPADVEDLFRFETPANGYVQLSVSPASGLDAEIHLLDGDGHSPLASANQAGPGGGEPIVYPNLRAGGYYVLVSAVSGAGEYVITLDYSPSAGDDPEPNGSAVQAASLEPGGTSRGNLGYRGQGVIDRMDVYRVVLDSQGFLDLTLNPGQNLNASLTLTDMDGVAVLASADAAGNGGTEEIEYTNLAAGTYYVIAAHVGGYGNYSIDGLISPAAEWDAEAAAEPDGGWRTARPAALADTGGGNLAGEVAGTLGYYGGGQRDDGDWISLDLPSPGSLGIEFDNADERSLDVRYDLYEGGGRYLGSSFANFWNVDTRSAGIHYLKIRREFEFGAYRINLSFAPAAPSEAFAPDAVPLALNETLEGLALSEEIPSLFYRLDVPQNGLLRLTAQFGEALWSRLYLYHMNGEFLAEANIYFTPDPQTIEIPNLRAGTYIAELRRVQQAGTGSLATVFEPLAHYDGESNDDPSFRSAVFVGEPLAGNVGYTGNGWRDTADYFNLTAADDGILSATLTGVEPLWCEMIVYEHLGAHLREIGRTGSYFATSPVGVRVSNVRAGRYTAAVLWRQGYGEYTLESSLEVNRSGGPLADDFAFQAQAIGPGGGRAGHMGFTRGNYTDSSDWYEIELPEDGILSVHTHCESSLWTETSLLDANFSTAMANAGNYFTDAMSTASHDHLRAGTYYIRVNRRQGYGTYELHTQFAPRGASAATLDAISSFTQPLEVDERVGGTLGFTNPSRTDTADWRRIEIASAGNYEIAMQADPQLWAEFALYRPNARTQILRDGRYFTSGLLRRTVDLEPGTYYLACTLRQGYGRYHLRLGNPATPVAGVLQGVVRGADGNGLADINVTILDRTVQTGGNGSYVFDELPPGEHAIRFGSDTMYYAVEQTVTIEAGGAANLDVTLLESNLTAPADVRVLYGEAMERYVHLFWPPSASPDVPDGGGYKLYVNDEPAIDLGLPLSYRAAGFEPGREYTFRLTVVDKYGNESQGREIVLTPSGDSAEPTPTPVAPISTPTPTPTPTGPGETPTVPAPTSPPGANTPTPPAPTPTQGVPIATPTPPAAPEPMWVYEFDGDDLAASGWSEIPGGFTSQNPEEDAGEVRIGGFDQPWFADSADNRGLTLTAGPGQVAFAYAIEALDSEGLPLLLRVSVRAEQPDAGIWLAALKGSFVTGEELDTSIGLVNAASASRFAEADGSLVLLYQPDTGRLVTPVIQLAAGPNAAGAAVHIDKLEVFRLDPESPYLGKTFNLNY